MTMKHGSHPHSKTMIINKIVTFLDLIGEPSLHSKEATLTQVLPERGETELFQF